MLMKALSEFAVAILAAVACIGQARAETVYSNIDPGDSFGPGVAIGVVPFVGVFNYAGVGFTPGQNYDLESLELAVSLSSGPNVLDVYFMSSLDGLPNQVLESFALDNQLATDSANGLVTIDSVTHPELVAGQEYWVVAAGGPTTFANWQENIHNIEGANVSGASLGTLVRDSDSNVVEALDVNGTAAVPEPRYGILVVSALLLGLTYRLKTNYCLLSFLSPQRQHRQ
jgi:hypothetical protein